MTFDTAQLNTNTRCIVTTSWDDGHVDDIRLAALLKKYGIKGTFYIAPENVEFPKEKLLTIDQIRELGTSFEIGAHTRTHHHLPTLLDAEAREEIATSKKTLEDIIGKPVTTFCYPAGKYEPRHVAMVRDAGIRFARTVKRFSFSVPEPLEAHTSIHTYDHWSDIWNLAQFVHFNPIRFLSLYHKWDKQAIAMFDKVYAEGGVFHLWGHSWELADNNGWERLEHVLAYIGARDDVSYVPNGALV